MNLLTVILTTLAGYVLMHYTLISFEVDSRTARVIALIFAFVVAFLVLVS